MWVDLKTRPHKVSTTTSSRQDDAQWSRDQQVRLGRHAHVVGHAARPVAHTSSLQSQCGVLLSHGRWSSTVAAVTQTSRLLHRLPAAGAAASASVNTITSLLADHLTSSTQPQMTVQGGGGSKTRPLFVCLIAPIFKSTKLMQQKNDRK